MTECLRSRIARRPNFSYKEAYDYLDKNRDGTVDGRDLKEMLSEHCFYATDREIISIMQKFDRDGDERINFNEFIEEITPKL